MKRKKAVKWSLLLLAVLTLAVYCFIWPGRGISEEVLAYGGYTRRNSYIVLDGEEAARVVRTLRRPHIPTVPAKCDCGADLGVVLTDGETEYHFSIRSHDKQGSLWINDEKAAIFYIPPWELSDIVDMLE